MNTHTHRVKYEPKTPDQTGYGVCECGATIRIEHGRPVGNWHACKLCSSEVRP